MRQTPHDGFTFRYWEQSDQGVFLVKMWFFFVQKMITISVEFGIFINKGGKVALFTTL